MTDIVWQSKLDGIYDVIVEANGPYSGVLRVYDSGKVLLAKPVSLAYGAMFGPDISDVTEWERIACECVDGLA